MPASPRVALVTLGCARNEVDSEELAGRLQGADWAVVDDADRADVVLVNTCGFVAAAKRESLDVLLDAAGAGDRPVVAVGCLAERYGDQLADAIPEAAAVLGFDDYPQIDQRLRAVLAGERPAAHHPQDRRRLLPVTPVRRADRAGPLPGHGGDRTRLGSGPSAALKLASGCDRRCSFCAIPMFRGAFVSRPPADVLAEARWLAGEGVREVLLVSENSTSYGKDLGDLRLLETLLPQLAAIEGLDRVRVSYLQPAEVRPGLLDVLTGTPGVAAYFDLSFQHASARVLRRMRRFGDAAAFLDLLDRIRDRDPAAGVRSNVIVGFPGETEADLEELEGFLGAAGLDAVGVFGYSAEEGTEAARLDGSLPDDEIRRRVDRVAGLVEEVQAQRAEDRVGCEVRVLVEQAPATPSGLGEGRAAHQGPEDGSTRLVAGRPGTSSSDGTALLSGSDGAVPVTGPVRVGDLVPARVVATAGVDLIAVPR